MEEFLVCRAGREAEDGCLDLPSMDRLPKCPLTHGLTTNPWPRRGSPARGNGADAPCPSVYLGQEQRLSLPSPQRVDQMGKLHGAPRACCPLAACALRAQVCAGAASTLI